MGTVQEAILPKQYFYGIKGKKWAQWGWSKDEYQWWWNREGETYGWWKCHFVKTTREVRDKEAIERIERIEKQMGSLAMKLLELRERQKKA